MNGRQTTSIDPKTVVDAGGADPRCLAVHVHRGGWLSPWRATRREPNSRR